MSEQNKVFIGFCCGLLAVTFAALLIRTCNRQEPQIIIQRDTVVRVDTFIERVPVPVRVTQLRTEYIPVTDTLRLRDTLYVEVPIEQKVYEDSLYTAYVSGYHPALDSLRLYIPTTTITNTVTRKEQAPRWSLGVQTGVGAVWGIGEKYPNLGAYVGVGVSYRIPLKSVGK